MGQPLLGDARVGQPPGFHHYLTGEEGVVEIESHWTATRREKQGIYPTVRRRDPA
jgi:hypothetical protein